MWPDEGTTISRSDQRAIRRFLRVTRRDWNILAVALYERLNTLVEGAGPEQTILELGHQTIALIFPSFYACYRSGFHLPFTRVGKGEMRRLLNIWWRYEGVSWYVASCEEHERRLHQLESLRQAMYLGHNKSEAKRS